MDQSASNGRPIRLALIGIGKIARDQHLPAIQANPAFELVATASREGSIDGVPSHPDIESLLAGGHDLDAVSLATPAAGRHVLAATAIEAGLAVMLEKPPAATLGEAQDLADRASARGVTLFTSWHSREAASVDRVRDELGRRTVTAVRIAWKEDIRRWHPGQEWILGEGGFGVFDPGINALSILTRILPSPVLVERCHMEVPRGRASPLRATMTMRSGAARVEAEFDFLQTGPQTWSIEVDTDAGLLAMTDGGATLRIGNGEASSDENREYARLYEHFAALVASRASDVDLAPHRLVADAFLVATRRDGESFSF